MNLKANSYKLRQDILDIVYHAKGGHIGGDMSVIDTLNVLYNKQMNVTPENFHDPDHDRFILSKGHTVEALYAVLCQKGFFPREDLKTVSQYLSKYIGHPNNKVNGIEMNSGSLGHGLSVAIGMALAGKMDKRDYRVYVVMGDGELAEGSVWEGAMAGGHYKLDNLCAVIDRNRLQISGTTEYVMNPVSYTHLVLENTELPSGRKTRLPTEQGVKLGIETRQRTSQHGEEYTAVVYSKQARQFKRSQGMTPLEFRRKDGDGVGTVE